MIVDDRFESSVDTAVTTYLSGLYIIQTKNMINHNNPTPIERPLIQSHPSRIIIQMFFDNLFLFQLNDVLTEYWLSSGSI